MLSLSTTVRSTLRLARRNAGKIALVTAVAGTAVYAANYFRRQYREMNAGLAAERAEGARKLRTAFMASSHTLSTTFCALLPRLAAEIAACSETDASPALARLRERPTDRAEKSALWEQVRVSSITALVATAHLLGTLHATLALQLNLLTRYAGAIADAPVQAMPAGQLQPETSRRFLEVCSRDVVGHERVGQVVKAVQCAVKEELGDVQLTDVLSIEEVEERLHKVLQRVADRERAESGSPHPALASATLFNNPDEACDGDVNLMWLIRETLDLCEVLGFEDVIGSLGNTVLREAMTLVRADIENGNQSSNGLPFAQVLGRLSMVATKISGEGEEMNFVEAALRSDEVGMHFGAAVFLSGEKEREEGGLYGGLSTSGRQATEAHRVSTELGPVQAQPILNDNGGGEAEMRREGSGDNLGLMFDMANAENDPN